MSHRNQPSTKGVSHTNFAQQKITSESSKARLSDEPSNDRPTPLNFDNFIPWICLEMQCLHEVFVKRQPTIEDYKDLLQKKRENKSSVSLRRSVTGKVIKGKREDDEESPTIPSPEHLPDSTESVHDENALIIQTYYTTRGNLVEVAIVGYRYEMSRKVLQALNICFPFHSSWTKLTLSKVKLNSSLMSEIARMIPHSNLTDIHFHDLFLPEANYYLLLDYVSSLRYLSLKRCYINDLACKELASRLDYGQPASKTLLLLDLGSNNITDFGAIYIGDALRMNRRLLHINLSDNAITDIGVAGLLKHLMEFEIMFDEILNKKRRRRKYLEERKIVYESCLKEVLLYQSISLRSTTYLTTPSTGRSTNRSTNRSTMLTRSSKTLNRKRATVLEQSAPMKAEIMTQKILGDFIDVFDDDNVIMRDGRFYCIGNLVLCSINLSYTNLELPSLMKLCDVLKYQRTCISLMSDLNTTGLLRVLVEGSYTPESCVELNDIQMYLKQAVVAKTPQQTSKYKV